MNREKIPEASAMWKAGALARDVAALLGIKIQALGMMCTRNRILFPRRAKHRAGRKGNRFRIPKPANEAVLEQPRNAGHMRWITQDGAFVTLPRITGIDCPRSSAERELFKTEGAG